MAKHALPNEAPTPGRHAGYYDVIKELYALLAELRQLLRRLND